MSTNAENAASWFKTASDHDAHDRMAEALAAYARVFEIGVTHLAPADQPRAYIQYGSTLRNALQLDQSLEILREGLVLFPDHPALHCFLLLSCHTRGDHRATTKSALSVLKKAGDEAFGGYHRALRWYIDNADSYPERPWPQDIFTSRLLIRGIKDSDAEALYAFWSRPEVARFVTWEPHKSLDETRRKVAEIHGYYQRGHYGSLAIALRESPDTAIGTAGWWWCDRKNKTIELAYTLSPDVWGQGIAVEACRALVDDLLARHDIRRITARHITGNTASERVMQKLGMTLESVQRDGMEIKGSPVDSATYCILAREWPTRRAENRPPSGCEFTPPRARG